MVILENLRVLGSGSDFTVVSDDPLLCDELRAQKVPTLRWTPELQVEEGANIALALCHQLVSRAVRKQFSNARVLVLPIYSFDDSFDSILYTMRLVFATDYVDNCRRNHEWIELLGEKADGVLRFSGPATDLHCALHDELRASTSLELVIKKGEWVSVADYCEVSVTAPSQTDWCGAFTINGTAEAAGVLVAEDSRVTPVGADRIRAARKLRTELVENGPVKLEVEDGILRSAVVAGKDVVRDLAEVTNPEYSLHTLELGLGSNPGIAPLVDWRRNSQLNEGVGQVHLGFGEGMTGAHMDFIIDQVAVA
jgi:hypothetical protein